jgi:glycosyltransferase involved in cell wall biosynthesis
MPNDRILMILHLPPPVHGAAMMGQNIKESSLLNQRFEADYINLSTSDTLEGVEKIKAGKIKSLLKIHRKIVQHLLHYKYQLCYITMTTSGPGFYKDLFMVLTLRLFRKKIIYHFHNKGISRHTNPVVKLLSWLAYHNTTAVVLSEKLKNDVTYYFKEENIFVCPNGIPEKQEQTTEKVEHTTCRLLFLSNMMEEKGPLVLLEACSLLKKEYQLNFECVFAGNWFDITEEEFLQKVKQADLEKETRYVGAVAGEVKEKLFAEADVFVFPTYYHNECFPLVLLEAMQQRLPVVSTFEGGIPDMIQDGVNGCLVPQRNAKELAEKLKQLITSPELRTQLGEAGYHNYKANYTQQQFEERLASILHTAATEGRKSYLPSLLT